ncbi:Hypothetical protein TR210_2459 [Trichococcus ilyis]|uniref:Uncharacterized protein n=1 Tax=Trichococcus ilyis TaxID=640938 RepID=A0A143Z9E2_9LACT|nr:Hypothetical protein TR210_2459 [Trichococcus ilyis]
MCWMSDTSALSDKQVQVVALVVRFLGVIGQARPSRCAGCPIPRRYRTNSSKSLRWLSDTSALSDKHVQVVVLVVQYYGVIGQTRPSRCAGCPIPRRYRTNSSKSLRWLSDSSALSDKHVQVVALVVRYFGVIGQARPSRCAGCPILRRYRTNSSKSLRWLSDTSALSDKLVQVVALVVRFLGVIGQARPSRCAGCPILRRYRTNSSKSLRWLSDSSALSDKHTQVVALVVRFFGVIGHSLEIVRKLSLLLPAIP